jgi:hypothetical protein
MAVGPCKASFKNSRIFPRSAVTSSVTGQVNIANAGAGPTPNGNTILKLANPNRVVLTFYNEAVVDGGADLFYSYSDDAAMAANGMKLKAGAAIDLVDQATIYVAGDGAATVGYYDEGSG